MHDVDEIGGEAAIEGAGSQVQRLVLRCIGLCLSDVAGFDHRAKDHVAPGDGALSLVVIGIKRAGLLDHAGEQRAFGQIELAHIFAEVGLGGLAHSVDAERSLLAEGNLVGIHLEDLLFGVAVFELEGDRGLDDLAPDTPGPGEIKKLRESCMVSVEALPR